MEFQITQDFGDRSYGYIYFEIHPDATIEQIKQKAISEQKKEYENRMPGFMGHKATERPTIQVKEYRSGKPVKEQIRFSVRWR